MSETPLELSTMKYTLAEKLTRYWSSGVWNVRTYYSRLWWKIVPGTVISVPWPTDDLAFGRRSSDPNDCFRPWLTDQVGRQSWDWEWDIGDISAYDGRGELLVKFRRGREQQSLIFSLKWGQP
jgi:hypothetical protein